MTYARFYTKEPDGNISGNTGQAIIDMEQGEIQYNEYEQSTGGTKIPSLYISDDMITNQIFIKNYNKDNQISDVDLKSNIYVVFNENINTNIISNINCILKDENDKTINGEILTNTYNLNVNGVNKTIPKGAIKFAIQDIFKAQEMVRKGYKIEITLKEDSLPTTKIMSNMKVYCQAEQNL